MYNKGDFNQFYCDGLGQWNPKNNKQKNNNRFLEKFGLEIEDN